MIIILTMITTSVVFFMGVVLGYKLAKGKEIDLPTVSEIKEHIPFTKENKQSKSVEKELENFNIIASNIERFDGTPYNQTKLKK